MMKSYVRLLFHLLHVFIETLLQNIYILMTEHSSAKNAFEKLSQAT